MPNLTRLEPWIEEDEEYVAAMNGAAFSTLSINTLYLFQWANRVFDSMEDFITEMAEIVNSIGLPLDLDAANCYPDDKFWVGLRTSGTEDLFGNSWIPTGVDGEPGGDMYAPGNQAADVFQPDGTVDGFDFLRSANKTAVFIATIIVLKIAGKDLLRFMSSSGGWVGKTIMQVHSMARYHDRSTQLDSIESDVTKLMADDDLSSMLDGDYSTLNTDYGASILRALELLGVALDTNTKLDYLAYNNFLKQVAE